MMYAGKRSAARAKTIVIKTTFLDLIAKLVDASSDDAAILGSVKHILDHCNVRLVRSLAPVRLINSKATLEQSARR
jgi:hypothetical protein